MACASSQASGDGHIGAAKLGADADEEKLDEEAQVVEKPEAPAGIGDLLQGLKDHATASVDGPWQAKLCYYVLMMLAFLALLLSLVNIFHQAADETITSSEVFLRDRIPMPGIFGCLPALEGYPLFTHSVCGPDSIGTIHHITGEPPECFRWTAAKGGVGGLQSVKWTKTEKERELLSTVVKFFASHHLDIPTWTCFLGNVDGGLWSERAKPARVELRGNFTFNSSTTPEIKSLVYFGLFQPNSDVTSIIHSSKYFVGSSINSVNALNIDYDEETDLRGDPSSIEKGLSGRQPSALYKGTATTASLTYNWQRAPLDSWSPQVVCSFAIGSFVSRSISLRHKYMSEVWVEIGGAWASAFLVITFFFYDKFGGKKGRIKVLRFNFGRQTDESLVAAAKRHGRKILRVGDQLLGSEDESGAEAGDASLSEEQIKTAITSLLKDPRVQSQMGDILREECAKQVRLKHGGSSSSESPAVGDLRAIGEGTEDSVMVLSTDVEPRLGDAPTLPGQTTC